jgi:RNA polymerase sigma-70 factor (ECF subfamily)
MSQALQEPPGTEPLGNRDQTDATVVAESQRTPECFAMLFDRHAPAIHRYAARRLGPDAADDLVAETPR